MSTVLLSYKNIFTGHKDYDMDILSLIILSPLPDINVILPKDIKVV